MANRRCRDRWRFTLLASAVAASAASLCVIIATLRSIEQLTPRGRSEAEAAERRVTALGRQLGRVQHRERLGAWIQQEILRANPRLDVVDAREYARLVLEITEKYNSVDPLFLLAVGIVESRFTVRATSHADARGIYQIWPATARWLAGELGWEFSEAMLYEPEKNTELAACYLDKLFATYGDSRLVLAEYNGGPTNARRLRNGNAHLAAETRDYVAKVMGVLDDLNERYDAVLPSRDDAPVRIAAAVTLAASTDASN